MSLDYNSHNMRTQSCTQNKTSNVGFTVYINEVKQHQPVSKVLGNEVHLWCRTDMNFHFFMTTNLC